MAGKLMRLHPGNFALTGVSAINADILPNPPGASSPGTPGHGEPGTADEPDAEVVRLAGYGRHVRAAEAGQAEAPTPAGTTPAGTTPAATTPAGTGPAGAPAPAGTVSGGAGPAGAPTLAIRSAERRRWSAELAGSALAGMVVHGVGGIGKSVLAAQIAARLPDLHPDCVTGSLSGEITPDTFLAAVCTAARRHPLAADRGGTVASAIAAVDRAVQPWPQRMKLLREHVLSQVPLLLVLDNFDDNLALEDGTCTIRDPELVGLLKFWADRLHLGRLLITCRHPFALPAGTSRRIWFRPLGPLSQAGATDLATSLSALGLLGQRDLDQAWRLLGGHPRAMEYLDGLLAAGQVTFAELAGRLGGVIPAVSGTSVPRPRPAAQAALAAPTELPLPAAEAAALAVSGVLLTELFDQLSPAARGLLTRASVYRAPIGREVLLLPVGQYSPAELTSLLDECRIRRLLTADLGADSPSVSVHRWTADELHQLLVARGHGTELADAHHRAAEYWRWRLTSSPQDEHAQREARYHLLRASELERPPSAEGRPGAHRAARHLPLRRLRRRLRPYAVATVAVAVTAFLTAEASGALSADHLTSSVTTAGALSGPVAAARSQAASWVKAQVSPGDIVSCDPAMCAVLQAHGVAGGNLLVLRTGSADPLGSDVVVATPAVRAQFGVRLASVYAPQVLARFGTGAQQIEVRAVAPDGAAAFNAALAADLSARRAAGRQLARNSRLTISGPARAALQSGQVDSRLLVILAALTASHRLTIISFGSTGPGAGTPLRSVRATADQSGLTAMLAFVQAQRVPYRPEHASVARAAGSPVLAIGFTAPSPAGLLTTQTTP